MLAVATTAWLTGPLTTAAPAAPDRGVAPTKIRVVPAKVFENRPAGTKVGRIVVRDRDRGDRHTFKLVRGKRFFEVVGHSLVTIRPLDHEKRPKLKIRLRATDAAGHRFARTLRVRVADVDDPPTAVDDTLTVLEDGGPQLLDVLDNDTDSDYEGGPRHIASVTQPEHGVVALFGRATVLTYEPDPDYCNETTTDDFTYTIVYGGSTGTVGVIVECVQDAPVAVDDTRTTPEDTPLVLPAAGPDSPIQNDTDADGDALTDQRCVRCRRRLRRPGSRRDHVHSRRRPLRTGRRQLRLHGLRRPWRRRHRHRRGHDHLRGRRDAGSASTAHPSRTTSRSPAPVRRSATPRSS